MATHRLHAEIVEHLPSLRRYALALARDRDAAEDLVQEALARAIKGAATWDPSRSLRVWLFGILHNTWVDLHRRRNVEEEGAAVLRAGEPRHTPPDQADRVLFGQTMAALFRLPAEQREVLLLTAMDGLSYRDAAEIIGIPPGTLMSRLARARQALREATDWADGPAAEREGETGGRRLPHLRLVRN